MLAIPSVPSDGPALTPRAEQRPSVGVVLTSDVHLIAEAVAAALASRGLQVSVLAWPEAAAASAQAELATADVAVLLYDVDMSLRMIRARAFLRSRPGPSLVLTGAPPGPAWGGLRTAGATAVRSGDCSLAEVEELIRMLAAGEPDPDAAAMEGYVEAWDALQERSGQLQRRLDGLAPREREVLVLLSRGVRVQPIAEQLGLSEATVRTQVRAVLRKLGVRTQLAAVAKLHAMDRLA